jgi:outer membrane lipoprotein carrier protein
MNRLLLTSYLLFLTYDSSLASAAGPADATLSEVIEKIQSVYETTRDLQADFHQVTRFEGFEAVVASSGKLYIKKPGRLRWDYAEPNQNEVVVSQDRVWLFTPELKQVIISPFALLSDSQMPLHFLMGVGRLDQDFEIKWAEPKDAADTATGQERLVLTLLPKDKKAGLDKIRMEVHPKQYFITQLDLFESNGNTSSFTFSRIETNVGLKDKLFIFTAPKGVEIIETPLGR